MNELLERFMKLTAEQKTEVIEMIEACEAENAMAEAEEINGHPTIIEDENDDLSDLTLEEPKVEGAR